ncbi:hypothetical protein [Peribacillus deserti]|uniref:Threonine dehydratase n=1 Tax=Peribacillus deserti TaxID=673318 RepID=A0A2N5M303_9BACI|nr:hypothetical protein [Peribacillus deserti]PLT28737.1 hypothetical protein CUU66_17195 [Peribacillus deserti]
MEFSLCAFDCAIPIEVTLDEDNGRYMVRKSDTSGEFFNTAVELIDWIRQNFSEEQFCTPDEFHGMLKQLNEYQDQSV